MPGVKIELPRLFSFNTLIAVRITDINYGGHVGNDSILSIIHEARIRFLNHHGYVSELDVDGVGLIMSNVSIAFKKELRYGDEVKAYVTSGEPTRISFDLFYKLERQTINGTQIAVVARSEMVCYDYSLNKIAPVPAALLAKLLL